ADYETLVNHYPASAYADNALWQAGRLSLDAFVRFDQPRDKAAATRLLRLLVAGYPKSKFVKLVSAQFARDGTARSGDDESVNPAPSPKVSEPAAAERTHATVRDIRRALLPDL